MAKTSKTAPTVSPLAFDTGIIVGAFKTFGDLSVPADAIQAMVRRVTDKDAFNAIRVKALAAWLENQRAYDAALALRNVDGKLSAPKFGKAETQRTAAQHADYVSAKNAWNYFLTRAGIETQNKRKPLSAGEKAAAKAAKLAKIAAEAAKSAPPVTPESVVVTRGDMSAVVMQLGAMNALCQRIVKVNAKPLTGDKGQAIRDLATHIAREMARIEKLEG